MLMLVPCAALAEEDDEPVTPMYELTMAHGFRFGGALSYMQFSSFYTISRFTCTICLHLFPSGVRSFHLA